MNDTTELSPQYSAAEIEPPLYQEWLARGLFTPQPREGAELFVMVIPPPNVTAQLHMGHGLNDTVQDVIVRFERMRQRETLWLPGTDHAGIATQNVIERLLAKEGLTRFDVGRDAFVERAAGVRRRNGIDDPRAAQGHRLLPATGRAPATPSPTRCRSRCARCSCGCGKRTSSIAATG